MKKPSRIEVYVGCLVVSTLGILRFSSAQSAGFPGAWELLVLTAMAFFIDTARTRLRTGEGSGSLAFIIRLASGLLFGPFWGALVAAVSSALAQIQRRNALIKSIFNVAQNSLSVI